MTEHNKCLCACEPCSRGWHCRGEFCTGLPSRPMTDAQGFAFLERVARVGRQPAR